MHPSRQHPFVFVTGGCRSGKSAYAQALAEKLAPRSLYIATAQVRDAEMRERVRLHQEARGENWRLHELTCDTDGERAGAWDDLPSLLRPGESLLFDCLTLWVAGRMARDDSAPKDFASACAALLCALWAVPGPVVVVSNEVGMGVVPPTASGRLFRDLAGYAGQQTAAMATHAVLVVSGLPLALKGELLL